LDNLNYLNEKKARSIAIDTCKHIISSPLEVQLKELEQEQLDQKGNHFLWITPPVTIIRQACKNMIINDISPEKTAEEIQNKVNLYLLENR
jgi:hypothetical protein